jgi:hypothetical protein
MCSEFRSGTLTIPGCSFVVLLHSFLIFASLPIWLSPVREIGGLSCTDIGVSCLGGCIGHILVAMSLDSWTRIMTWVGARSIWSVVVH